MTSQNRSRKEHIIRTNNILVIVWKSNSTENIAVIADIHTIYWLFVIGAYFLVHHVQSYHIRSTSPNTLAERSIRQSVVLEASIVQSGCAARSVMPFAARLNSTREVLLDVSACANASQPASRIRLWRRMIRRRVVLRVRLNASDRAPSGPMLLWVRSSYTQRDIM